jgi:hypothetical protein
MAASVSVVTGPEVPGNRKFVTADVTFDSSYATGGEAISVSSLGLTRLDFMWVSPSDGYVAQWNGSLTSPKIELFGTNKDVVGVTTGPLTEVANAFDVSSVTVKVFAFGA